MRPSYEVHAVRKDGWWMLTVPKVPGAVSQVHRLSDVDDYIRDAIAYVLDIPNDSFDIAVNADVAMSDMDSAQA
ncbi:MAG: hypothetical protein ABIM89_08485 [Mycobacteriales bacterium]